VMTVQIGPSLRDTISVPSYTVGVRPPRSGTRGPNQTHRNARGSCRPRVRSGFVT